MVYEGDTDHGHYLIVDSIYAGRPARVLYSERRAAAQSALPRDGNPWPLFDYNQRFMELVRGLRPKRVLLIGGGALSLPAAMNQEFPDIGLDVVELDGKLVELAEKYFGFQPGKHTRLHIGDGRRFLATAKETYDMIIVDVFEHATIPESFQSAEAMRALRRHLKRRGVMAMNVIASLDGRRSQVLKRLQEAAQATFPAVDIFPASANLSHWLPQNLILATHDGSRDLAGLLPYGPFYQSKN